MYLNPAYGSDCIEKVETADVVFHGRFRALGSGLTGLQTAKVSAATNAVPSYEVKLLAKPETVLEYGGSLRSEVIQAFGIASVPQAIGVAYFDTDNLGLNAEGWDVRFRKKRIKITMSLPIRNGIPS